jgi:hypothetical protein
MTRKIRSLLILLVGAAFLFPGTAAQAAQPVDHGELGEAVLDTGTWAEVSAWLKNRKDVIELKAATIIIEVNSTAGDAGFQIFLDSEGYRNVRVFDPNGNRILYVNVTGGVRTIGGGTELFLETVEPEYDTLDEMQDLIDLLPEGEYYFLARTTDNNWATATAELTHTVPAGPVIVEPMPTGDEDECTTGVFVDSAVIEWDPVDTDIWGASDIEIVGYQVIVETDEDLIHYYTVTVPAETTMVDVPEGVLAEGTEFIFEVLAIEESGNQTITEGCFETEE